MAVHLHECHVRSGQKLQLQLEYAGHRTDILVENLGTILRIQEYTQNPKDGIVIQDNLQFGF